MLLDALGCGLLGRVLRHLLPADGDSDDNCRCTIPCTLAQRCRAARGDIRAARLACRALDEAARQELASRLVLSPQNLAAGRPDWSRFPAVTALAFDGWFVTPPKPQQKKQKKKQTKKPKKKQKQQQEQQQQQQEESPDPWDAVVQQHLLLDDIIPSARELGRVVAPGAGPPERLLQQITHLEVQGGLHWNYLEDILERLPNLTHFVAGGGRYHQHAKDDAYAATRAIGVLAVWELDHRLQSVVAPSMVIDYETYAYLSRLPCLSELVADGIDEQWKEPSLELTSLTRLWLSHFSGRSRLSVNLPQAEELTQIDLTPVTADALAHAAPRLRRLSFFDTTSGRAAWRVPVTHAFHNVTHLYIQASKNLVSAHFKSRFPALEHLGLEVNMDVYSDDDDDGDGDGGGGARFDVASLLAGLTGLRSLDLERVEPGWITPAARDAIAALTRLERLGVPVDVGDPASLAWLARVTTVVSLTLAPWTATMREDDDQPVEVSLALEAAAHLPRLASLVLMVPLFTSPKTYPAVWDLAPFLRFARGTTFLRTLVFRDMALPPDMFLSVLAAHPRLRVVESAWRPGEADELAISGELLELFEDSCSAGGPSMQEDFAEWKPWECRACSWKLPVID